ncbi:MAG: hypothetical protein Q4D53_04395 [Leptotrichiaceae bacterium]|nr:hypothetical protein [Leptotrichiaceae bacterium]
MEGIKEKLSEKYLKMEDYFNMSYDIFKKLIFKNKFIITGIFVSLTLNIMRAKMTEEYLRSAKDRNLEEFIQIVVKDTESTLPTIINILLGVLLVIIMKKLAYEI